MQTSWITPLALLLSLLAHVALFWQPGGRINKAPSPVKEAQRTTRVHFNTPMAKPSAVESKPKIKPRPRRKKPVRKPIPKRTPQTVQQTKVEKKPVKKEKPMPLINEPVAAALSPQQEITRLDPALLEDRRRRYLEKLMSCIEAHKFYPRLARTRGIVGQVRVSFTVLPGGTVERIEIESGPRPLRLAARKAVMNALPLPLPPEDLSLPFAVKYAMEFSLR